MNPCTSAKAGDQVAVTVVDTVIDVVPVVALAEDRGVEEFQVEVVRAKLMTILSAHHHRPDRR